jgi:transposase
MAGSGQVSGDWAWFCASAEEVVVERDFAWASRFRRLVRDYERLPQTVAGLHFVAFACL